MRRQIAFVLAMMVIVPANSPAVGQGGKGEIWSMPAWERGRPVWTKDICERGGVFVNPGKCYRCGISYNAGLKRCLWCQTIYGDDDMRFKGGLGIYDGPEPWTTVYYAEQWDVGPGETSRFPTKWMSKDGKTCYLLFSGDDCFSVRKARLTD